MGKLAPYACDQCGWKQCHAHKTKDDERDFFTLSVVISKAQLGGYILKTISALNVVTESTWCDVCCRALLLSNLIREYHGLGCQADTVKAAQDGAAQ